MTPCIQRYFYNTMYKRQRDTVYFIRNFRKSRERFEGICETCAAPNIFTKLRMEWLSGTIYNILYIIFSAIFMTSTSPKVFKLLLAKENVINYVSYSQIINVCGWSNLIKRHIYTFNYCWHIFFWICLASCKYLEIYHGV